MSTALAHRPGVFMLRTADQPTQIIVQNLPSAVASLTHEPDDQDVDLGLETEFRTDPITFDQFRLQHPVISEVVHALAEQYAELICSDQIGVHNILAPIGAPALMLGTKEYALIARAEPEIATLRKLASPESEDVSAAYNFKSELIEGYVGVVAYTIPDNLSESVTQLPLDQIIAFQLQQTAQRVWQACIITPHDLRTGQGTAKTRSVITSHIHPDDRGISDVDLDAPYINTTALMVFDRSNITVFIVPEEHSPEFLRAALLDRISSLQKVARDLRAHELHAILSCQLYSPSSPEMEITASAYSPPGVLLPTQAQLLVSLLTEVNEKFAFRYTALLDQLQVQDDQTPLICFGHCLEARVRSNHQAEKPVDAEKLLRQAFSDSIATRWWFLLGEKSSESTEVLGRVPSPHIITSLLLGGDDARHINLKDYLSLLVQRGSREHLELLHHSLGAELRTFPLEEVLSERSYHNLRLKQEDFLHSLFFTENHPFANWASYWLDSAPVRSIDEVISIVNRTESCNERQKQAVLTTSTGVLTDQVEEMLSRLSEIVSPEARLRVLQHLSKVTVGPPISLATHIDDQMFSFIKSDLYKAFTLLEDNFHSIIVARRAELGIDSKVVHKYFGYLFASSFVDTLIRNADLGEFDKDIHAIFTYRYASSRDPNRQREIEMKDLLLSRLALHTKGNPYLDDILSIANQFKYAGVLSTEHKEAIRRLKLSFSPSSFSSHESAATEQSTNVLDTTLAGRSIAVMTRIANAQRLERSMIVEAASMLPAYLSDETHRQYPLEYLNKEQLLISLGSKLQQYVRSHVDTDARSFPELASLIRSVRDELTTILTRKEEQYGNHNPVVRAVLLSGLTKLRQSIPNHLP